MLLRHKNIFSKLSNNLFHNNRRFFGSCGNIFLSNRNINDQQKYTIWVWGSGMAPKLLDKSTCKKPTKLENFQCCNVDDVAAGLSHYAFIVDGVLYTCGNNSYCQLGRSTNDGSSECFIPSPIRLSSQHKFIKVACGAYHTAAITDNGLLFTWGWGGSFFYGAGGLGHGYKSLISEPTLVEHFSNSNEFVIDVACGSQHTIVLTKNNTLYSTGRGEFGRLGRGNNGDQLSFEEITFFNSLDEQKNFIKIDSGASHSAALTDNGEIWVWGRNDYGQLGLEDSMGDMYSNEIYPKLMQSFIDEHIKIIDISCGDFHMLATSENGVAYFWGSRLWLTPKPISQHRSHKNSSVKHELIRVAAGGGNQFYNMAICDEGNLYSWGRNNSLCLARDIHYRDANEPILIPNSTFDDQKVAGISCGRSGVLAVTVK